MTTVHGAGSSPHTRGAHAGLRRRRNPCRIIPAYAGSTFRRSSGSGRRPDHPRIRGEHSFEKLPSAMARGSSPHTRGALRAVHLPTRAPGIIPAYAGSTPPTNTKENPHDGSSPHTRGALAPAAASARPTGIIPAYAGSTGTLRLSYIQFRDHPRIRGEHSKRASCSSGIRGSSPHTRGAPARRAGLGCRRRIIPAYAGSTPCGASTNGTLSDHPRIRGEHIPTPPTAARPRGSSPHTRGAPSLPGWLCRQSRIIPAYAGSTSPRSTAAAAPSDHPRIRGEHDAFLERDGEAGGSSPHTRGALAASLAVESTDGIIPAYAGSTRYGIRAAYR